MSNGKVILTVDEIIAAINHSYEPTVLIEGVNDIIVYRKIEDIADVSVLQTGGRVALLELFCRRHEFLGKKVAFVADQDYWCITGIPGKFLSDFLIFTDGYSLENDIFCDINVLGMFSSQEKIIFQDEIEKFSKWYSLALSRHIEDGIEVISHHPNKILSNDLKYQELCQLHNNEQYPNLILDIVQINPFKKIRGKSLMDLALRQLGSPSREVHHKNSKVFLDVAAANPGILLRKIFDKVQFAMELN